VPGKTPDTASLDFGEIALNTYDGLAFMKKSGSAGIEIVTLGSGGSTINTGSFATTGSNTFIGNQIISGSLIVTSITGSLLGTASLALQVSTSISTQNQQHNVLFTDTSGPGYIQVDGGLRYNPNQDLLTTTASFALNAATASSADNFTVRGTLTAQTIVAQTITASTEFITGSSRFGSLITDTHQFTGSVSMTGSLAVNNSLAVTGSLNISGSAGTILFTTNTDTLLLTGSAIITGSVAVTGSLSVLGSIIGSLTGTATTASYVLQAVSSSFATTASSADNFTVRGTLTATTIVAQTITASTEFITGSSIFGSLITDTHQFTGSVSISGSLTIPNLTSGSVIFAGTNGILSQSNSNFFWDNTNGRLGIGIAVPLFTVHATGGVRGNTLFASTAATIGGTTAANASAVIDIISTTKGLLPPRTNLTSNIATPVQGLITYLTGSTNEGLYYYSSGSIKAWTKLLNDTGSQSITCSLLLSTGSMFGLPLTSSAAPVTGSMYWSGSLLFIYNGTRYMSASFV
jgi:hypothetical protein